MPKLSIVTTSYNQGPYLEQTILSVLNQGYADLEYIVIDGGSTDGSVEILRHYDSHLAYWVSEPDRGQVHALNKGIARTTGDIFAFINSDDVYLPGAFAAVAAAFQKTADVMWVCGDTIMFGDAHPTRIIRATVPRTAAHALAWAYEAPQPGMFWRRELVQEGFDEAWNYAFDHDAYVRLLLQGHECVHIPLPLAAYRLHTDSKTVADQSSFDPEFDAIADKYVDRLRGRARRWSSATIHLRRSFHAAGEGKRGTAVRDLALAVLTHPPILAGRPFWGCAKKIISRTDTR